MSNTERLPKDLFDTVVNNGYCVGCGTCAAFDPQIRIKFNDCGQYVATLEAGSVGVSLAATRVCPFADSGVDENDLAREVFGDCGLIDSHVGYHIANYAGWVNECDFRAHGSSGGMATWLLMELLERDLVDHVVHVEAVPSTNKGLPLFRFAVSSTSEEIRSNAKSRYYPVEMSGVVSTMLSSPGRYAVVGIPCFIKSLRLASRESSLLRQRLAFCIGIVCGHMKSAAFAELLAWQCGVSPAELKTIDFRTKLPDRPASTYAVTVVGERDGKEISSSKPTSELFGSNWGHGFFKYKACDFCDDVTGETADISIGDAWLREYERDSSGTNVLVVRKEALNHILSTAADEGRISINAIGVEKVVESQAGGFRHRRDGLAYRLLLEDQGGRWRPPKRVKPSANHLGQKLRNSYLLRYELGQKSHEVFAAAKARGDLNEFMQVMAPLASKYDRLHRRPLLFRILGKLKRNVLSLLSAHNTRA